jgi:hypothetical protein
MFQVVGSCSGFHATEDITIEWLILVRQSGRNEMDVKLEESRLQSYRFRNIDRVNLHQDIVNPHLPVAIVEPFAEPSELSDHRLLRYPPSGRVIKCVLTKVTKFRGFGTTCLSFGKDVEQQF